MKPASRASACRHGSASGRPRARRRFCIAKLNAATVEALADPAVRQRLQQELSLEIPSPDMQTPGALRAFQAAEIEKWWPIIRAAKIKAE